MKLILTCIFAILFKSITFSQFFGWSFDQVVRLKGSNYEMTSSRNDKNEDIYSIKYKYQNYVNGKDDGFGIIERYIFKRSDNKVFSFSFIGQKKENEIIEIIETNNKKYKVIDKGKDQEAFEWLDEENSVLYILNFIGIYTSGYKAVSYLVGQ